MQQTSVLVTGGAGFIGSTLVRHLIAHYEDISVVTADALTYAGHRASLGAALQSPRHTFEHVDVADPQAIDALFRTHRPSAVFHLAAESHVDRSIDGPADFIRTNVVGTSTLLECATRHRSTLPAAERDAFRFVHISTDEVFGALGAEGKFTPETPYSPRSPYAASKAASDHLVRAWGHTYGLPVVITNCCNNYGPYQYPEKLIPLVIQKAVTRQDIPVYGRGDQVRDWLHVEDHVRALIAAWKRGTPGETYLVGADCERRNLEVVEAICDIVDELVADGGAPRRAQIRHVTDRPGHDFRYAIDASATRRSLGWTPKVDFATGLRETVAWYLANGAWCETVRADKYDGKRLGLGAAA